MVLVNRYNWFYSKSIQVQTSCLYWLYEVWTRSFEAVKPASSSIFCRWLISIYPQHTNNSWSICAEESSIMNQNTGSLERKATNTSDMPPDNCMPYRKTWLPSYQSIGMFSHQACITTKHQSNACNNHFAGIYCTSSRMKMFLWVPGSLASTSSI